MAGMTAAQPRTREALRLPIGHDSADPFKLTLSTSNKVRHGSPEHQRDQSETCYETNGL